MSLLANSNAIESGGYNIDRSLRFRSSASAYLNRTPASNTNRQISTFSAWIKWSLTGSSPYPVIFGAAPNGSTYRDGLYFNGSNLTVLFNGGVSYMLTTSQVFRDPSAWYHVILAIDTTQATASNRVKLYVNGSQVTAFGTANYPTQNYNPNFNSAIVHNIGRSTDANDYFDGYLAEVNFIDGQALTPSSFGQTDPVTGVWQPLKYMGTYGTNGFYLPFSDNTSATTLAYDKSGNGNNWTPNNISTTAGDTYDSMTDVPTLTSATAANYCVLNPLDKGSTVTNGNLTTNSAAAHQSVRATMQIPSTGLYYMEATILSTTSATVLAGLGLATPSVALTGSLASAANAWFVYCGDVLYINRNGTPTLVGSTTAAGSILQIAVDMANSRAWFGINNTWYDGTSGTTGNPSTGANPTFTSIASGVAPILETYQDTLDANFGQRPFSYTPPTGFVALNTFNLPDPTIKKPNQYMDATLYSGTSASQSVTNAGSFQPDLVWIKSRSAATDHKLTDSVRGVTKALISDTTGAETTDTNGLTAFNSNGFTVGSDSVYNNGTGPATYVGWQWKAGGTSSSNTSGSITSTVSVNTTAGFSIVTYTGTGSAGTIGHGLGVAPKMIIVKSRDQGTTGYTGNWYVYHASNTSAPETDYLLLNTTAATADDTFWNDTAPTSTVFSVGALSGTNDSSDKFVAYCWAEIAGFSKFGSYTGNGSADGPFVYTNFQPRYILIKQSSASGEDWIVQDTARKPYNTSGTSTSLFPDSSSAEVNTAAQLWDVTSNGFKIRASGGGVNTNGATYIYAAFASNPFKFSTAF